MTKAPADAFLARTIDDVFRDLCCVRSRQPGFTASQFLGVWSRCRALCTTPWIPLHESYRNARGNMSAVALSLILALLSLHPGGSGQIAAISEHGQASNARQTVSITFAKSPYSDFLFYLLYRSTSSYGELKAAVPLDSIPPLDGSSFLPEDSIASGVSTYDGLAKLAAGYDDHLRLTEMLKKAEPSYPAFYAFWSKRIGPAEEETEHAWVRQTQWDPVRHLEEMERLKFPFSSIAVDLIALDPQGSSMQKPATIFTTLDVPGLAWAIGHEGTHMMVGPNGANWRARKGANEAIRQMNSNGGSDYDLEEALCLLMQARLSIANGATATDFRSSSGLKASPRKKLLIVLEDDWQDYVKSSHQDAADWLIAETLKAFH
jgi:hypothetical protein